jgi:mannose-1-phosphate guanylyltransferase
MTFERLEGLVPPERVWVVTTAATAAATRELLPELPVKNVLAEPVGRNTAACAGFAAHAVLARDREGVCVVFPADHVIGEIDRFRSAMGVGARLVESEGGLLTFGVKPTRPETGYGYLEVGDEHRRDGEWAIHGLQRFVEKPDADRAQQYIDSGHFLWNAGIFAWRARDLLDEIDRQLPELGEGLSILAASLGSSTIDTVLGEIYPSLPATSVDFGIMEKATRCWVVPVDFPWSDVGSWPALEEVLSVDDSGNLRRGRVLAEGASGNVLVSTGPTISVVGVDDLVVVATPDAVLVVPKNEAQKVKDVVEALKAKGWDDVL